MSVAEAASRYLPDLKAAVEKIEAQLDGSEIEVPLPTAITPPR